MPWQRPTVQEIYQRITAGIESRLTGGVALLRRAVLRILAKVFAGEIHLNYGYTAWIAKQILPDTAEDEMLDRHAYVWGLTRKQGKAATGLVRFAGTAGALVPERSILQNTAGIEYQTTVATTIGAGGTAEVTAQASEIGEESNFDGATLQLVSPLEGVESEVTVVSPIAGGQNEETSDGLRARILQRIQEPPLGGAKHDYVRWALEVPGVNRAWCFSPEDTPQTVPGIVRVVFMVTGSNPVPTAPLFIDDGSGKDNGTGTVYAYIKERKPVTAELQVFPIERIDVDITLKITPFSSELSEQINTNLKAMFDRVSSPGGVIYISHIRDAIMSSGVDNYAITDIVLNGIHYEEQDIWVSGFSFPIFNQAYVSEL